jgi:hypothetical protein
MVASSAASSLAVGEQVSSAGVADTSSTTAGAAAYLASGERVRELTDLAVKVSAGVFVLVALAWAVGVLPGAFKLF